jgi:hypothetical protein
MVDHFLLAQFDEVQGCERSRAAHSGCSETRLRRINHLRVDLHTTIGVKAGIRQSLCAEN